MCHIKPEIYVWNKFSSCEFRGRYLGVSLALNMIWSTDMPEGSCPELKGDPVFPSFRFLFSHCHFILRTIHKENGALFCCRGNFERKLISHTLVFLFSFDLQWWESSCKTGNWNWNPLCWEMISNIYVLDMHKMQNKWSTPITHFFIASSTNQHFFHNAVTAECHLVPLLLFCTLSKTGLEYVFAICISCRTSFSWSRPIMNCV